MKSPETTLAILGTLIFLAFLLFLGTMAQITFDCRTEAMKAKYPAIEIQGICK